MEQRFSILQGKDITITENALGKVTNVTVDPVCNYPCGDNTRYAEGQDARLIEKGCHKWSNGGWRGE